MSTAQKVMGWTILGIVAFSALNQWLFEAVLNGLAPGSGMSGAAEMLVLDLPNNLPYLLTPYLIAQPVVLIFWAFRSPRVVGDAQLGTAARSLSGWLRWSLLILAIYIAAGALSFLSKQLLTVPLMLLLPVFGWAYTCSIYRALQLHKYLEQKGLSKTRTHYMALGAALPSMAIPLWPLGLLIPGIVWRRFRAQEAL